MKTKEEVIKEAYNNLCLPFNDNYLHNNGWMKIKPCQYSYVYDSVDLLKLTESCTFCSPKIPFRTRNKQRLDKDRRCRRYTN